MIINSFIIPIVNHSIYGIPEISGYYEIGIQVDSNEQSDYEIITLHII